jgi:hypothetical protein
MEALDSRAVISHFDRGFSIWPDSHILLLRLGEYYRYIWDFGNAILTLREVVQRATNGDVRREAAVHLAGALHAAGTYQHVIGGDNASVTIGQDLLREAKAIVHDIIGHTEVANEVALLRDHIALELDEEVGWTAIDKLFGILVGNVDGFPNVLLENLDRLRDAPLEVPRQLHEGVHQNFTNITVLGLMGMLYLRRAEKELSSEPLRDATDAYAIFGACSTLERSWRGHESPLTSFRRGRAIYFASRVRNSLNPFKGADCQGKQDQLALAEALLQSASDRATGDFRVVAVRFRMETQKLRGALATIKRPR